MATNAIALIDRLIHTVRGKRVMLDADFARIYGVTTARLNQQVGRNIDRFPPDFLLHLSAEEAKCLMLQIATSKPGRGGRRKAVLAFTQEGVAMLSSVLRSPRAVQANVAIMRAFVRYREAALQNAELSEKFRELVGRVDKHDKEIGVILQAIQRMLAGPKKKRRPSIGFKPLADGTSPAGRTGGGNAPA